MATVLRSSTLRAVLAVAVAVSVVHYVDNVVSYADYPEPTSGPAPSRTVIAVSWFVFTACAAAALWCHAHGRWRAAAVALALYSGSGLVGLGHYTVPGAFDMPWWRQAHIVLDIACGVAVLALAVALLRADPARVRR